MCVVFTLARRILAGRILAGRILARRILARRILACADRRDLAGRITVRRQRCVWLTRPVCALGIGDRPG